MKCPSCGSTAIAVRGQLPVSDYFAGRERREPLPAGKLVACEACGLNFRYPRLPQHVLDDLYRDAGSEVWQYDPADRIDWDAAWKIAGSLSPGRALDVGCFDGSFLAGLPEGWARFGVEPSPAAADRARLRNVNILAETFEEVRGSGGAGYDLITAFDLIEHLPEPNRLVEFAAGALNPGGRLIVGTGDTDAPSWHLMGAQYWYCAIPEHLSFINERWIRFAAKQSGLAVDHLRRYTHQPRASVGRRAFEVAANVAHRISPRITGALRSAGFGGMDVRLDANKKQFPPLWMSARDHILAVLRK
ncbi:MAG TPA: class I SAM-dependent methyltransferase [Rhodothermales bacterium]